MEQTTEVKPSHVIGNWHTVNDLIVKETLKMVFKCTNAEAPSYLACLFDRFPETSTRGLRNTETDLRVPFLRTHVAKNASLLEKGIYGMAWTQNQINEYLQII